QRLRNENGTDGAGIWRPVSVSANAGIHGTCIHARATADTVQGAASVLVRKEPSAPVVDKHQMKFCRAVGLTVAAWSVQKRHVTGHFLTGCGARQQLQKNFRI